MLDRLNTALAGRYAVERELGRGGMATVWLARDLKHDRPVALKVLHSDLAHQIGVDRFVREVRLSARLQHPNIVPVLDSGVLTAGDETSLPWYTMAYLPGESLRTRLARESQLAVDEVIRITEACAAALEAAHQEGIVHRDIKPENILLSEGQVYVVDFGIAKALLETGGERLTSTGIVIGTPAYMSPEQASAAPVDARTDQYSLATVSYEMLAGEPPFTGPTVQVIVARRLAEPARPLRSVRSAVSLPLERAVLKALERVPADRFPDMASFAAALRSGSVAEPRRRGHLVSIAGLLLLVGLGVWAAASARGHAAASPTGSRNPEITALYQRGVQGYDRRTPAGIVDAVAAFTAAVQRDSSYTDAWTGLGKSYVRAYERGFPIPGVKHDSLPRLAVAAVDRALALNPEFAEAWATHALVSRIIDPTDVGPLLRSARRALALDSSNVQGWHALAMGLAESGQMDSALVAWRRTVALNPRYTQGLGFLAQASYWHGQFDSAARWADSGIAVDPNYLLARSVAGYAGVEQANFTRAAAAFEATRRLTNGIEGLNAVAGSALVAARAGRPSEARASLGEVEQQAHELQPIPLHTAVFVAQAYAGLGNRDRALEWLQRYAPLADLHFQLHLRCDAAFAPLSGDSRFRALLLTPLSAPRQGC